MMVRATEEIRPNGLYTLKEAAAYLRVSDATARRWIKSGLLRARKIGRDYRISGEELAHCLKRSDADKYPVPRPLDPNGPMLKLIGIGSSGHTDIAQNHDEYLAQIYREEADPPEGPR